MCRAFRGEPSSAPHPVTGPPRTVAREGHRAAEVGSPRSHLRPGLRARLAPALLLPALLLLLPAAAFAEGASPFPGVHVLGWTQDGVLATVTITGLGRGEVLLHGMPLRRIPVKDAGLCGSAPRWACRLELDLARPERPAAAWLDTVRRDLALVPPVPGLPPVLTGGQPVYPVPGGAWALEVSDEASGYLPLVELVLADRPRELRFLAWQAWFGLDPDEPLQPLWHPRRPLGVLLAHSAARPYPAVVLAAELDLSRPIEVEQQALRRLAAALRDRPGTSVKLAALVEEVRSRSQRRVELGSILRAALAATCPGEAEPVGLDALSFDWSELERGGLLTWGCPVPDAPAAAGRVSPGYTLFRREQGRWTVHRSFPETPGAAAEVELRLLDLTMDGHPEIWVRQRGAGRAGSYQVLGWRANGVESLLAGGFAASCTAGNGGPAFVENPTIADPGDKGVPAVVIERWLFAAAGPACRPSPPGPVLQQQQVVWRWNSRLKRFNRRLQVVSPAGAAAIPLPGEGPATKGAPPADPGVPGGAGSGSEDFLLPGLPPSKSPLDAPGAGPQGAGAPPLAAPALSADQQFR